MRKSWPAIRRSTSGAPGPRRIGHAVVDTARTRRFDWQTLRFDDGQRMADDTLLPRSSTCRRLPVVFISGSLSNVAADFRRGAVPVPATRPSTTPEAAVARGQRDTGSRR